MEKPKTQIHRGDRISEYVIHVGLHKTGTTFLQNCLFKNMNVNYVPYRRILNFIPDQTRPNLISQECLSGRPFYTIEKEDTRFIIADRLKKLFPNAKIIIGTRELHDWLVSGWKQSIKMGYKKSFFDWSQSVNREYWNMDRYADYLKKNFNDVYRYDLADLKNDNHRIIKEICEFVGVPVPIYKKQIKNPSLTKAQSSFLRIFNKPFHSKEECLHENYPISELYHDTKKCIYNMRRK